MLHRIAPLSLALVVSACTESPKPDRYPACGTAQPPRGALVPGPNEAGHDAELARLARQYDRQFTALSSWSTGVTSDVELVDDAGERARLTRFLREEDGWTFDAAPVVKSWSKNAGLYAGVGIVADAYRYGVLRDEGAACAEVEQARRQLVRGLEALHLASEVTGVPGVIARGYLRRDHAGGDAYELTPLFDGQGRPFPLEKTNGTWRADNSGKHPELIWEDSCSRDMLLGWAAAFGAVWEVVLDDPSFDAALKGTLRKDATAIARELMKVRESGYDLEIPDADGRTTFHGYLNENNFDRAYLPGIDNGFHAVMALGIVGALARVSGEADVRAYLEDELIGKRRLPSIVGPGLKLTFLGTETNGSNVNMAFTAMWLALRTIDHAPTRETLRAALRDDLYAPEVPMWKPSELGQSLFDFIAAAHGAETGAVERGLGTLREFPEPPYLNAGRINCDEAELASRQCVLEDGTTVEIHEKPARGGDVQATTPIPMRARPPSNYWWRSNPYQVNGEGNGSAVLSGVDFRVAYWLGRWAKGE